MRRTQAMGQLQKKIYTLTRYGYRRFRHVKDPLNRVSSHVTPHYEASGCYGCSLFTNNNEKFHMKLAQALKLRKDLCLKLETAVNDARAAVFDETAKPSAKARVSRCFYLSNAIIDLTTAIDRANSSNSVAFDGADNFRSLSSLRAERDRLTTTVETLRPLGSVGTQLVLRGSQTRDDEGKLVRTPDTTHPVQFDLLLVNELINSSCKRIRMLDAALQQANWQVEVVCESANAEL